MTDEQLLKIWRALPTPQRNIDETIVAFARAIENIALEQPEKLSALSLCLVPTLPEPDLANHGFSARKMHEYAFVAIQEDRAKIIRANLARQCRRSGEIIKSNCMKVVVVNEVAAQEKEKA